MVISLSLLRIFTLVQIFTSCALASTVISSPSSTSPWKINTSSKVTFASSSDLQDFTVEILNADQKILSGAYALASSDQLKLWDYMLPCPGLPAAFGYVLLFVNVSSPSQVFASSEQFAIEAENNTSTSPSSPTTSYLIYPSQVALPASFSPSPVSSSTPSASSSQVSSGHRRGSFNLLGLLLPTLVLSSLVLVVVGASRT
ncbi:hypothetical protein BDY24DRAFT_376015 [Mrakia frigida]|uniref:uncharacterized protein n=1 Tax=Mrakia frigida TaxID=29902 RepID=UPI003FCC1E14